MATIKSSISTEELQRFVAALQAAPDKLARQLEATGVACAKILEHHLRQKAPKFLGELQASIDGRVEREGKTVQAAVVSPVPYAHIQDVGRRPGKMPPEDAIRRWVELKLFKRAGAKPSGDLGEQIDRTTYLIRRAIGRKGTKPTKYIDKATAAARPALQRKLDDLAREIERIVHE